MLRRGDGGVGAGDEVEAEGGVEGGGLAGFAVGEEFDVGVAAGVDFVDGGLGHGTRMRLAGTLVRVLDWPLGSVIWREGMMRISQPGPEFSLPVIFKVGEAFGGDGGGDGVEAGVEAGGGEEEVEETVAVVVEGGEPPAMVSGRSYWAEGA